MKSNNLNLIRAEAAELGWGAGGLSNEISGAQRPPSPLPFPTPPRFGASIRLVWQNIQSHNLFTNRFVRIALVEIIYCRNFSEQLRPVFEKPINCWIFLLNWTEAVCIWHYLCLYLDTIYSGLTQTSIREAYA